MHTRHAALFLAPAIAVTAAVFLIPLGQIAYTSLDGPALSGRAYVELASSGVFWRVLYNSFETSLGSTLACVLLGYPIAYHLSRVSPRRRTIYAIFVLLPLWTSILVKSFAFTVILGENGIINNILRFLAGPRAAVALLFNSVGVLVGMVHYLLPFMVFPILVSLTAQGDHLHLAARVMGATRLRIFLQITLPLSLTGVLAGCIMTTVLSLGVFVTPALLGGRRDVMMANLIDFYTRVSLDWAAASAIAIILLVVTSALLITLLRLPGEHRLI